jgi:Ca2+-binding RTX toxin-like protein
VLRVFDSNGRQLAYNDNSSTGTVNSRVQLSVVAGWTYYVGVTGAGKAASRYDPRTGEGVGDNTDGSTGGYALLVDGGFAVVRNGRLDVSGTGSDDSIGISNRAGVVRVTRNGSTIAFSSKLIRSVQVAAGDGDDRASLGAAVPGAVIDGGNGNDTLSGGQFNDRIIGGPGRNQLAGGAGNDTISGGNSADAISGNDGNDRIYGNGGNDTIDGGNGSDAIRGGDGNDNLTARAGNDHLFGDSGDDTLTGGPGRDTLDGGDGTDRGVVDSLDTTTSIER